MQPELNHQTWRLTFCPALLQTCSTMGLDVQGEKLREHGLGIRE